ncbi:MAG: redoxin domain-containing protein [Alphaproteobacteria bacterium]|nr:redoxin domain-containing protein [Alphaproteobacteria bacterium]
MKKSLIALAALCLVSAPAFAAPVVGEAAPTFSATDTKGNTVKLEDYKGKTVVLEWTNHGCPFVRKHYDSGNMQKTQKQAIDEGAVWLSVISSAEGKQGHVTGAEADKLTEDRGAAPTAVLLDPAGEIGKLYDAKTTPHMFVIDPRGMLVYAGAIDSIPSPFPSDIGKAENYVMSALADMKAEKPVQTAVTTAYGCSVKYAE